MVRVSIVILVLAGAAAGTWASVGSEPVTPIQPAAQPDPARAELGRKLFHDTQLSRGNARACATCHRLNAGGDDDEVRSPGADGRLLDYNAPTIFNVAVNFRLNWRGNFQTIEEQNESVLLDARVMNTTWPELLAKLQADPTYPKDFTGLYGGRPTRARVLDALAAFQRSLATPDSRFDRYLRGEREAISPDEENGYQLFKSYGCIACHQGANLGGNLFQKVGIFREPFRRQAATMESDLGRFSITGLDADRKVFRVPSLRNVALTAPYFHNGYTWSLTEAVEIMAKSQLGRELPGRDVDRIVAFLNTLTGEYQGRSLAEADRARR
jgi:cytochrome c peroxidase